MPELAMWLAHGAEGAVCSLLSWDGVLWAGNSCGGCTCWLALSLTLTNPLEKGKQEAFYIYFFFVLQCRALSDFPKVKYAKSSKIKL